jgi:hypothetical protein
MTNFMEYFIFHYLPLGDIRFDRVLFTGGDVG